MLPPLSIGHLWASVALKTVPAIAERQCYPLPFPAMTYRGPNSPEEFGNICSMAVFTYFTGLCNKGSEKSIFNIYG